MLSTVLRNVFFIRVIRYPLGIIGKKDYDNEDSARGLTVNLFASISLCVSRNSALRTRDRYRTEIYPIIRERTCVFEE